MLQGSMYVTSEKNTQRTTTKKTSKSSKNTIRLQNSKWSITIFQKYGTSPKVSVTSMLTN